MPKGAKGQKRPADAVGNVVKIMRIATGEEHEEFPADDGKDKAAQSLGQRGGRVLAQKVTASAEEIAACAARERWGSTA